MKNLFDQEPYALRGENDARLADLTTRLVTAEATITAMANFLKATSAGRLVQSGSTVGTTNGGGGLTITFPTPFASAPVVVISNGDASAGDDWIIAVTQSSVSTTSFEAVVTNSADARVGSTSVRVNWIAFGAA